MIRRFFKKLFTLVLPIAFQNFMTAAVSASDAIMLGVISQEALSAVSGRADTVCPKPVFGSSDHWHYDSGSSVLGKRG